MAGRPKTVKATKDETIKETIKETIEGIKSNITDLKNSPEIITTLIIPPINSQAIVYNKTNSEVIVSNLGTVISINTDERIIYFDNGSKLIWS